MERLNAESVVYKGQPFNMGHITPAVAKSIAISAGYDTAFKRFFLMPVALELFGADKPGIILAMHGSQWFLGRLRGKAKVQCPEDINDFIYAEPIRPRGWHTALLREYSA